MSYGKYLFLVVGLSVLASATFAQKDGADAVGLIENAKHVSDIRAKGMQAFRLKMMFTISMEQGAALEGTYTEVWVSKAQWRRETRAGDFQSVQVASGAKSWLRDNNPSISEQIGYLQLLLEFNRFEPQDWKSMKDRVFNGASLRCVRNKHDGSHVLCFDKSSGTLTSETKSIRSGDWSEERFCSYSDYEKFGEQMIARSYECHEGKHLKLKATITSLMAEPAPDQALFAPLAGAKESTNCLGKVQHPTVVSDPPPRPVPNSSSSTTVLISLVVDANGNPQDLKVVSAPNDDLAAAALDAVRQWKFKAATCDGQPMESTIAVQTESFVMR